MLYFNEVNNIFLWMNGMSNEKKLSHKNLRF